MAHRSELVQRAVAVATLRRLHAARTTVVAAARTDGRCSRFHQPPEGGVVHVEVRCPRVHDRHIADQRQRLDELRIIFPVEVAVQAGLINNEQAGQTVAFYERALGNYTYLSTYRPKG